MGIVDFTNPDAANWYKGKLKKLMDIGVDCFKTDFGERIPVDVQYFDGSDPVKMHNYYTYLYNKAVYELMKENAPTNECVLFARSATAGSQKFPVHWGGDCTAEYESMAESLRGGLSLSLCGFGFWSHDISGFESTATPDLYKRWSAFGLLSTHSRLHGSNSYRVPWLFDEEAVEVLRFFTELKCSLMPYLYACACETSMTGIPVMRAMVLEFSDDPTCRFLDLQYMLGDSLLVAPIFNKDGNVSYYLPSGIWTNFITGDRVLGGCWKNETHDYMSIPLMVRPSSIIAVGDTESRPDYDYSDNVVFHIFELADRSEASTAVYNIKGEKELTANAKRNGNVIEFTLEGEKEKWKILLRGVNQISNVKGGTFEVLQTGTMIIPDTDTSMLIIEV
jgi:alpha-D-xyloside xylohydrolase